MRRSPETNQGERGLLTLPFYPSSLWARPIPCGSGGSCSGDSGLLGGRPFGQVHRLVHAISTS